MWSRSFAWRMAASASFGFGLLLLAAAVAEPPPGGKRSEEEEPKKPPMGGKREEEEEGGMGKGIIRVEDPPVVKSPARPAPLDINLAAAARQATHPGIKGLFGSLAVPHDLIKIHNPLIKNRPDERVKPMADYVGAQPSRLKADLIELKPFDKEWKEAPPIKLSPSAILKVIHYEELAQQEVDQFLGERYENVPAGQPNHLSPAAKLIAGEQALAAVARFHETARADDIRKGDAWNTVRDGLRSRLRDLALKRMQLLLEQDDWDSALTLASDTVKRFPSPEDQKAIAEPIAALAQKLLDTGADAARYKKVFERLQQIERSLPLADSTKPIRDRLIALALPHLTRAQELKAAKKLDEAKKELRTAEEIYPFLPGLRDLRTDVDDDYPTLRVGVRSLPRYMSPALASSDAEKLTLELLFEGLYELGPEPDGGRFRPALARGRPGLVALGREIALPRDAHWSNGKDITSADVVSTLRLLRSNWPGRTDAWADDLMDEPVVTESYQVKLTLKQGCLDPLALMSFKVLPQQILRRPDDKEFGEKPIGSGPFMLDTGAHSDAGRPYLRFVANPYYRNRPGRFGLPRIKEVQFFASSDPVKELAAGKLDLLPDVPLDMVSNLRKTANVTVAGPLPTRRIYMLAVNHRRTSLDSAALRKAIALAIPRDKILKDFFRGDLGDKVHQPLCGPFPSGSWACPPRKSADSDKSDILYNPNAAKAALQQSKKGKVQLELKFPLEDVAAGKAMEFLAKHLNTELGLNITPKPVTLLNLRDDVVRDHEYDLAYFWYDYPDPTFWLFPMLDSRSAGIGGGNFLGYNGAAGRLEQMCRNAMSHRNFEDVQAITHLIHDVFVREEMPFVPLWQLDRFIAYTNSLQLLDGTRPLNLSGPSPEIDPLRLFGTAEFWRKESVRK